MLTKASEVITYLCVQSVMCLTRQDQHLIWGQRREESKLTTFSIWDLTYQGGKMEEKLSLLFSKRYTSIGASTTKGINPTVEE
jgi:hypothetical protein